MATLSNIPGGPATSLSPTDKIYVAQGTADRSATIAQVGAAVGAGVSSVAGKTGTVTLTSTDIGNFAAAASAAAPVTSVAGRTGAVTLTTTDISGFATAASAAAPVTAVAGRTGSVTIGAADITSGTFNPARLASGTPAAGKYPDGSGAWTVLPTVSGGGGGSGTSNYPTPRDQGFTVDPTGSADSLAGLNQFAAWCATNHRTGFIPAGTYRTTGEWVIPAKGGGMIAENAAWQGTWIKPDNNTYNGVRMVGTFDEQDHRRIFQGFTISSANNSDAAKTGKAAFTVDNCPQARIIGVQVNNYDYGFNAINNNYDMAWFDCYTLREGYPNVNIGFLMRDYSTSGADWYCYNVHAGGRKAGLCAYNTGGLVMVGCSFGVLMANGTPTNDDYGPITLGKNPDDDSTPGGVYLAKFIRAHVEGWWYTYAIRAYGECSASFDTCAFLANQDETAKIARGFLRISDAKKSKFSFRDCDAGWKCVTASDNLCQIDGWDGGFIMDEHNWTSGGRNWSGGSFFGNWMQSLMEWSNYRGTTDQRGFATWANHDTWRSNLILNGVYIETNGNSNQLRVGTMNQSNRQITWRTI